MKGLADEMAAPGKKIDDDDLISHILNGLDSDYNPFVSSLSVKENLSLGDLYAQILSYEARFNQQRADEGRFYSSANSVSRGRGHGGGNSRGHDRGSTFSGRDNFNSNIGQSTGRGGASGSSDPDDGPLCQLCEHYGHTVHDCWYRFNKKFVAPRDGGSRQPKQGVQKSASSGVPSYGIDTNWYFDSGSIDHITNTLDNPTTREQYHGQDQIHATNGKGMSISHIGNTTFHTPHS